MSRNARLLSCLLVAAAAITGLHVWINIGFDRLLAPGDQPRRVRVAYLPVT
jgi:hypothetical protein